MNPKFLPVTPDRWSDLTKVMGGCENADKCWCAYWYRSNSDYRNGWGEGNRAFMKEIVQRGDEPGLLAYLGKAPIGWVGVGPRGVFERLTSSNTFEPIDDEPVWAINCFVVMPNYRQRGVLPRMIKAATSYAFSKGAPGVEAYPVARTDRASVNELAVGSLNAFIKAGFVEVGQPTMHRRIVRLMQSDTDVVRERASA